VLTRKGGGTVILSATGPPLGVEQDVEWEQVASETTQGDRLVMVTDGLPELSSPTGEMFGRRRLQSLLEQNRDQPLHILRGRILETLAAHGGGSRPADDVTVLAVDL
ncbi:MAG: serine/threonine-protein phosphatase, partial [Candidatus Brocadiae bacterium]|nr:serine/threonine-protein phosphatase [Candidatus Brocadiia bacterium]